MAPLSYTLVEPKGALSPLVVDSPHSGRIYPAEFAYVCPLPLLRQAEDAYMDEIISGAVEAGATVMMAEFPRTMIDVNRAENDIDPTVIEGIWPEPLAPKSSTSTSFGLIRHRLRSGVPLYRAPLSIKEIQYRIDHYYRPYHDCLKKQIDRRIKNFGVCYFINAHSMPHYLDKELPMPDFVLGDRDGTSCDRSFTRRAQSILQDMGYHVVLNEPYKGREIVQRYGLEGQGAQALQIEVRRGLYMDEIAIEKHSGFLSLQRNMTRFFTYLMASIQNDASDRLAAE